MRPDAHILNRPYQNITIIDLTRFKLPSFHKFSPKSYVVITPTWQCRQTLVRIDGRFWAPSTSPILVAFFQKMEVRESLPLNLECPPIHRDFSQDQDVRLQDFGGLRSKALVYALRFVRLRDPGVRGLEQIGSYCVGSSTETSKL